MLRLGKYFKAEDAEYSENASTVVGVWRGKGGAPRALLRLLPPLEAQARYGAPKEVTFQCSHLRIRSAVHMHLSPLSEPIHP